MVNALVNPVVKPPTPHPPTPDSQSPPKCQQEQHQQQQQGGRDGNGVSVSIEDQLRKSLVWVDVDIPIIALLDGVHSRCVWVCGVYGWCAAAHRCVFHGSHIQYIQCVCYVVLCVFMFCALHRVCFVQSCALHALQCCVYYTHPSSSC